MKKILILFSIVLVSFFGINKLNAATITNINYGLVGETNGTTVGTNNFSGKIPVLILNRPGLVQESYTMGSIDFTFSSPITGTGISYTITSLVRIEYDATQTFGIQNAIPYAFLSNTFNGIVKFEQGIINNSVFNSQLIDAGQGFVLIKLTSSVNLNASTNLKSIVVSMNAPQLFTCTVGPDKICKELYVGITSLSADVVISEDPNTGLLGGIQNQQQQTNNKLDITINQNQTIIDQNNQLNQNQQQTNEKLDDINNTLNDDTPPEADISALGNVQGLLPPGPLDSLLNIPFDFLSIAINSLTGTCVALTGNFVFDSTLTIPCFNDFYDDVPVSLMVFLNLIPSAFILIGYYKHLYKKVDRALSMNTTSDDEWGVL